MDEIEAKFTLPDAVTWQELRKSNRLGDYTLGAPQIETIQDTFLDTAGRAILSAGYYCRQRAYADQSGVWMTVKSLPEGGKGALPCAKAARSEKTMPAWRRSKSLALAAARGAKWRCTAPKMNSTVK